MARLPISFGQSKEQSRIMLCTLIKLPQLSDKSALNLNLYQENRLRGLSGTIPKPTCLPCIDYIKKGLQNGPTAQFIMRIDSRRGNDGHLCTLCFKTFRLHMRSLLDLSTISTLAESVHAWFSRIFPEVYCATHLTDSVMAWAFPTKTISS